jgi:CRP-like cAMP-binding protein
VTEATIARAPLLDGVNADDLAVLESSCKWRRYQMGERVFERGSDGREVFFVVEGAVNVTSFAKTGREVTFAKAGAGDVVGELAAIDGGPRSASVVAVEDSLLAVLPSQVFVDLIKRNGEVALRLLVRLAAIIRTGDEKVLEISSLRATNLVYAHLLKVAVRDEAAADLWVVKPLPGLGEIASLCGTTRELVSSALNELYPSGLITRRGPNLYVMDREALEDIVEAARHQAQA